MFEYLLIIPAYVIVFVVIWAACIGLTGLIVLAAKNLLMNKLKEAKEE